MHISKVSIQGYRNDARRTIQSVLDESFADTSAPGILRKRRNAISLCRTCSDTVLLPALILAAELIVDEAIPAQTQAELQALLSQPAQIQSFIPPRDDEIQAMTLHRSKGLEFDVVIHLDLVDWVFPKKHFDPASGAVSHQDYQQCLNLHYVGITRAKKGCILVTNSKRLNRNEIEINAQPSEFLGLQSVSGLFRKKTVA